MQATLRRMQPIAAYFRWRPACCRQATGGNQACQALSRGPGCPDRRSSAGTDAGSRRLSNKTALMTDAVQGEGMQSCRSESDCCKIIAALRDGQQRLPKRISWVDDSRNSQDSDNQLPPTCRKLREEADREAEHHPPPVVDLVGLSPPEEPAAGQGQRSGKVCHVHRSNLPHRHLAPRL